MHVLPLLTIFCTRDQGRLEELDEWDYGIIRTGDAFINIMPCLSSLEVFSCPKLKALPDHIHQRTTLKELRIGWDCDILVERYKRGEGEDWPKISHIPNLEIGRWQVISSLTLICFVVIFNLIKKHKFHFESKSGNTYFLIFWFSYPMNIQFLICDMMTLL